MLHQTDFLLDFYKYVALNMLRYASSSFLRERKNVFVGMVNNCSLTDCAVSSPLCWVSLWRLVSFNMIHQSNNGSLRHAPVSAFAHIIIITRGLCRTLCTSGTRAAKVRFSHSSSWTIADALL